MSPPTMEFQGDPGIVVENKREVCLVWEDLKVVSSSPKRTLLVGLSGYAEPNRIMALIGPSGAGKSTLLDALAGAQFSPSLHSSHKHNTA